MDAVRAVDVRVAGRAEHRRVARGLSAVAVRGGILVVVGLDLDDAPADAVDEQRRADELGRDLVHAAREEALRSFTLAASLRVVAEKRGHGGDEEPAAGDAGQDPAGDDREAEARQRGERAGLEVPDRRSARDLGELDSREAAAHRVRASR